MKDDLHLHLDGERPSDPLDGETRVEADRWERLLEAFRAHLAPPSPPPWLESRVMAEIQALPEPGILSRAGRWLTAPRPLRLSPLHLGLSAAALAAILFMGGRFFPPPLQGPAPEAVVYVQFALEAPGAESVAVAGDFDGWVGSHDLEDVDGDGVWTGRIALRPGVHAYMFLVDGSQWMTDPRAQRYTEDGFGNRNAVLAVAAPSA